MLDWVTSPPNAQIHALGLWFDDKNKCYDNVLWPIGLGIHKFILTEINKNKQEVNVPPYIRMPMNKYRKNDGFRKSLFGNYLTDKQFRLRINGW